MLHGIGIVLDFLFHSLCFLLPYIIKYLGIGLTDQMPKCLKVLMASRSLIDPVAKKRIFEINNPS